MPDIAGIVTAFDVAEVTAATQQLPGAPGRLARLGLFEERGITTTAAIVEFDGTLLELVPSVPRGAPGHYRGEGGRQGRAVIVPHLPVTGTIMADEIQNVRAFGTTGEVVAVRDYITRRLDLARRDIDATIEFHRMGALRGLITNSDGSVIYDLHADFDLTPQTLSLDLADTGTKLEAKAAAGLDMIEAALGLPFDGGRAFLGKTLWDGLLTHDGARDAFLSQTPPAGEARESVFFGGIRWERVRGTFGTTKMMPDDAGVLIPDNAPPGLFVTTYAPANWTETVNTEGQPVYAKVELMGRGGGLGKSSVGVDYEVQSNPLSICTRPRACIRLTA